MVKIKNVKSFFENPVTFIFIFILCLTVSVTFFLVLIKPEWFGMGKILNPKEVNNNAQTVVDTEDSAFKIDPKALPLNIPEDELNTSFRNMLIGQEVGKIKIVNSWLDIRNKEIHLSVTFSDNQKLRAVLITNANKQALVIKSIDLVNAGVWEKFKEMLLKSMIQKSSVLVFSQYGVENGKIEITDDSVVISK